MVIFFFVDDIAMLYDRKFIFQMDEFQTRLFKKYEMRFLNEIEWFLNIRISRDRYEKRMALSQNSYIEKFLAKFNIFINVNKRDPGAPLSEETLIKNTDQVTSQQIHAYQQKIDSINYAATITRSNVVLTVFKLSEFLTNSFKFHHVETDRVLIYLSYSKDLDIVFDVKIDNSQSIFFVSFDVFYADDSETRYNSQDYDFMLYNGMVD